MLLPQSPRHALLALALASAGFLGPWVLGGWQTAAPMHVAEPAELRVVHVLLPPEPPRPEVEEPSLDSQAQDTVDFL